MRSISKKDVLNFESNTLHTYRILSWLLTSLYYLFSDSSNLLIRLGVVVILFISSQFTIAVYDKTDDKSIDKSFVFLETIGISLLLLPTGGLNSPFIWYALNPVLISAYYISNIYCWFNLISFISISTIVTYIFFNPDNYSLYQLILNYSHLVLIFVLITFAVQLLLILNQKLKQQSESLIQANHRIHESMEHIYSLYQALEAFTIEENRSRIYQSFSDYMLKISKSTSTFFWYKPNNIDSSILSISGNLNTESKENLENKLEELWERYVSLGEYLEIDLDGRLFLASPVETNSRVFGLIGFQVLNSDYRYKNKEAIDQLLFISNLSAIVLERFHLEEVSERLIITEEQNRIANEMHDNVAQRLFSISCAIHTLIGKWQCMTKEQIDNKLLMLQESSNEAMKELRSTIYKLSSKKGGGNCFISDIRHHLDSMSSLNDIDISLDIKGDDQILDLSKKKVIYRIISEGIGNAIKHGKSTSIKVILIIELTNTSLSIVDNGVGFNVEDLDGAHTGLGIRNMKRLVNSLGGSFNISSEISSGTKIDIKIPSIDKSNLQGGLAI